MVWQKNFVRTKKHGGLELGQDSQRASNCRQLPDQPKPKAVHQGLVPCGRGCCPRSALSVPFLLPNDSFLLCLCCASVVLVMCLCCASVVPLLCLCCACDVSLLCLCCAYLINNKSRDRNRHATDVYTSRPKGFPFATLRLYESMLTRCACRPWI